MTETKLTIVSRNGEQSVRQYPNAMGLFLVGGRAAVSDYNHTQPRPRIAEDPLTTFTDWLDWVDHMLDEAEKRREKS